MSVPPSYEVARQAFEDSAPGPDCDRATKELAEALVRKWMVDLAPPEDEDGGP